MVSTGVGLAYPSLYLMCTVTDWASNYTLELATAVITAESFGSLFGRAGGGAIVSLTAVTAMSRASGLIVTYTVFAVFLAAAAIAAAHSTSASPSLAPERANAPRVGLLRGQAATAG